MRVNGRSAASVDCLMNGCSGATGLICDALQFATGSCNLGSVLEESTICKGMPWLTANDAGSRHAGFVIQCEGIHINSHLTDGNVSHTVILIGFNGMKAIGQGINCWNIDWCKLMDSLHARHSLGSLRACASGGCRSSGNCGDSGSIRFLQRSHLIFKQLHNG